MPTDHVGLLASIAFNCVSLSVCSGCRTVPPVVRGTTSTSVIDVLDHVLDKGIVLDAWVRVSLVGIDLLTVEAHIVVASIETYLNYTNGAGDGLKVSRSSTGSLSSRLPSANPTRR